MKILILKKERIITTTLPNNIYGDFQIVDVDSNGNQVDLITIRENNGKWLLNNTVDTAIIVNNQSVSSIELADYFSCEILYRKSDYKYILYCLPTYDNTTLFNVLDASILISNSNQADIFYQNSFLKTFDTQRERVVTVYGANGEPIREFKGTYNVEIFNDEYLVIMNQNTRERVNVYGGSTIVIDESPQFDHTLTE